MSVTTIKIDSEVRAHVRDAQRWFGDVTAEEAIEQLYWAEWERRAIVASHGLATDDKAYAEYVAEAREFSEATMGDGLADEPWHG